jgi:hypothetical protein
LSEIRVPEIEKISLGRTDPETGETETTDHLGDIVKWILATSPAIPAQNLKQLSERIGISYTNVRQWFEHGNSPNLKNLSIICANLRTDPIQFLLHWPDFTTSLGNRHGMVFDRIAGVLSKPDHAEKLLAILLEEQKLGLLESFLDQKAAELGVNPDHHVRSLERPAAPSRKKRKPA